MKTLFSGNCSLLYFSFDRLILMFAGFLYLGVGLTLGGCSKVESGHESLFRSKLPADEVDFATIQRPSNDPELARAALLARKSWPLFLRAWMRRRENSGTSFAVKIPVKEGDLTEHFWLEVTRLNGELITGLHDCDAIDVSTVRKGDLRTVKVSEIEDWLVSDSGVASGGFSVVILTKASLARENSLDSPDLKVAARTRKSLISHWKNLAHEADSPGDLALSAADISTYSQFFLLEKLLRGNSKHEPSLQELVGASGLPQEVVESLRQFRKARQAAVEQS